MTPHIKKIATVAGIAAAVIVAVVAVWVHMRPSGPGPGFISGNGRIEATEIDVATKMGGRVAAILVNEGDFVRVSQPLAQMQIDVLQTQLDAARAQSSQAVTAVAAAKAQVAARRSDTATAQAMEGQRRSDLDAARRRFTRSDALCKEGAISLQAFDDDRAKMRAAADGVTAASAQVSAAQAATRAAQAQVVGAGSGVSASVAAIARVQADIHDSQLRAPRAGRVQYRIAQPGEVLAAGGKVLNLVDLGDVYMTFFLSEAATGKVALGSEVHIILDAAPQYVIPAQVTYVASTAQFTPKMVETASERQKLMFRIKAKISRELLRKNLKMVKTGLPGVAWLKVDAQAKWPANLAVKVPQ